MSTAVTRESITPEDIQNLKDGDESVWGKLAKCIFRPYARRFESNPSNRDDLVQEIMLRAMTNNAVEKYDPTKSKPTVYFGRIAKQAHISLIRKRSAGIRSGSLPQLTRERRGYDEDITTRESTRKNYERAIAMVPNAQVRATIDLMYGRGLTKEQTAKVLGVPPGTIAAGLSRYLRKTEAELNNREAA